MNPIEDALAEIELLQQTEGFSYRKIAAKYGVVHSTLTQRHQCASISKFIKAQNQQALHPYQEQELLHCIKRLTKQGLLPTQAMIQYFGSDIAKRELGKGWVGSYIQQYQVDIILRRATGMGQSRHQADSGSSTTSTLSFCTIRSANTTLSPATCTTWTRKASSLELLLDQRGCSVGGCRRRTSSNQ
jgi:hypothetical protein